MKKLILALLGATFLTASTYAAQTSVTVAANSATNILVGSGRISQFVLSAPATLPATFIFLDSPTTNVIYTLAAYTNVTTSVGAYTNVYTNYFGVNTTNIYTAQTTSSNSVGPLTNSYNVIMSALVSSNSTLTIGNGVTFPNGSAYYYYQGVTLSNTAASAATATLTYQQ